MMIWSIRSLILVLMMSSTSLGAASVNLPNKLKAFADQQNQFSLWALSQWCEETTGNVALSGPTIWSLAALASNGATTSNALPLLKAIGIDRQPVADVNEYAHALFKHYAAQSEMSLAISIWLSNKYQLRETFTNLASKHYLAPVEAIDLTGTAGVKKINDWISGQTRGKITNMISELNPDGLAVLVSAAYLKAKWAEPFKKDLTKLEVFHKVGGDITVPMMRQWGQFSYKSTNGWEAVQIPYETDGLSMVVVLPTMGNTPEKVGAEISKSGWKSVGDGFQNLQGSVQLPGFKLDYSNYKVKELLDQLGGEEFELDALSDICLPIGEVVHRAVVEVDEEGTVAAAVTTMEASLAAPSQEKTFNFVADRPFLFFILDEKTDLIFFAGAVTQP